VFPFDTGDGLDGAGAGFGAGAGAGAGAGFGAGFGAFSSSHRF